MLTEAGCRQRRQNLWNRIPNDYSWLLVGDPRHVQYFSGFRINPLSFSADQRSLLLMQRDGRAVLLADNFGSRSATAESFVDQEVIFPWYNHRNSVVDRTAVLVDTLRQCEEFSRAGRGILEAHGVATGIAEVLADKCVTQFEDPVSDESVTLGHVIRELRRQKLPDEVDLLKTCMAACDAGHAAAFDFIEPGLTELEVYLEVSKAAQLQAGRACVVYGDFRATNAEVPKAGGLPTTYELQDGDLFILDYSVIIDGYRSDFTNTIAVGEPTDAQTDQFEACRDAISAAEAVLAAGVAAKEVFRAASAVIERRGYPTMAHHAGHGLGLEHPEPPILVPESTDVLIAGDVITLEPGLYVEGVGGMRFEHNYLITDDGCERLSNHHLGLVR